MTTLPNTVDPRQGQVAQKYAGYEVNVRDERSSHDVLHEPRGPEVLRVHFLVFRIPSRRVFEILHFADATATDRAQAEAKVPDIPRMYEVWERGGRAHKRRHSTKGYYYYWSACAGTYLDDPLVQLELEMMIDRGSGVTA